MSAAEGVFPVLFCVQLGTGRADLNLIRPSLKGTWNIFLRMQKHSNPSGNGVRSYLGRKGRLPTTRLLQAFSFRRFLGLGALGVYAAFS